MFAHAQIAEKQKEQQRLFRYTKRQVRDFFLIIAIWSAVRSVMLMNGFAFFHIPVFDSLLNMFNAFCLQGDFLSNAELFVMKLRYTYLK